MLAEEDKIYAQIMNGKVHWVFTIDDLPEWNEEDITVVDITHKVVEIGDLYDGSVFSKEILIKKIAPISPRQIRMVLLSMGITESMVDAQIEALESPEREQSMIAWKFSTSYERQIPMVSLIGSSLGLTSEQLDLIWISAVGI
jgi:hypothetical protein